VAGPRELRERHVALSPQTGAAETALRPWVRRTGTTTVSQGNERKDAMPGVSEKSQNSEVLEVKRTKVGD